jgi:hypothetical protein
MRPICQYRQQLFNCGHVVFHRSYATAGGRDKPVLVAVLGLKRWRIIICWWWYIAWCVSCLGCYCTLVTWHEGTLKDCLIGVQLSTSMFLFYSDILWDFHMKLENLTRTEQDLWRKFIIFQKGWAVQQEQRIALCWGTDHTGSERAACWDVLCSGGWVSYRHCIAKVWSGSVCMYVCPLSECNPLKL